MTNPARTGRRIAIVGSGFSGLCLAIQLKAVGMHNLTIFEKSDRLGGTWRDNSYPGAACDVPSFSYCFSFEQKTDWTRKWSPQAEILEYMEHCARRYDLYQHIRFNTEIASAKWDESELVWRIRTSAGEELVADILVSGVGQLNRPSTPEYPGSKDFRGIQFHSARWRHDVDLAGKKVAVIGNAASAIQFIPQIAPKVAKLSIFQRSANWMVPRGDRHYTETEKDRFRKYPGLTRLYRWLIWAQHEMNWPVFAGRQFFASRMQRAAEENLRASINDPKLQKLLTPDYPIGGKRILIADDYYPTLNRDNVEIISEAIDHFSENAVVTNDGRAIDADVVIYATGFESTSFLAPMAIRGEGGRTLNDEWKDGAHAYLGISVAGFPNLFLMYGPNTNLGHNSIIYMIECQTDYIVDFLKKMDATGIKALSVRPAVMESYDAAIQRDLAHTPWAKTGKSWYKLESGRITNNWPGSTIAYWWRTRHADLAQYTIAVSKRASRADVVPAAPTEREQRNVAAR